VEWINLVTVPVSHAPVKLSSLPSRSGVGTVVTPGAVS
jgi:hypothetical protein